LRLWEDDLTITPAYIGNNMVVCAEQEGDVVGFYTIAEITGELELDHFFLQPDHMGQGIGDALLRHAMACARDNGADALRIVSDPNAETFYVKYGAQRVGVVPSQPEGRELPLLRLPV
jgi:GNAT superfamily N-acetyltransferase